MNIFYCCSKSLGMIAAEAEAEAAAAASATTTKIWL